MSVFTNTIGIDVSKDKLDVHDYKLNKHHIFNNDKVGFKKLLAWVKSEHQDRVKSLLFCFEHAGIYSLGLSVFMEENELFYKIIPGLEIKRSTGMARGKNDQIDAFKIAQYAYYRRDELNPSKLPAAELLKLKDLLCLRERMVKQRSGYRAHLKELTRFSNRENNKLLFESQERMIKELCKEIKLVEKEMEQIIKENPAIQVQYKLATTVKGGGLILGGSLIVYSDNFSRFKNWRQFASYVGIAPFDYESGSSIKRSKQVSHMANKRLKALLSNAATSSMVHSPEMRLYYGKRIKEGKNKMLIQNIIRNKILSRVFAVVKRGTPYVNTLSYAA